MSCTHGYSGLTTSWFGIARVMSQETESIIVLTPNLLDIFFKMDSLFFYPDFQENDWLKYAVFHAGSVG
ncbi:MAG: hypothetical protein ACNA7V_06525 [Bacteroidales bacterium]